MSNENNSISSADGEWCIEASQAIVELTQYRTLQAQIASYTDSGVPEIHLYSFLSPNVSTAASLFPLFSCEFSNCSGNFLIDKHFVLFSEYCIHQSRASG